MASPFIHSNASSPIAIAAEKAAIASSSLTKIVSIIKNSNNVISDEMELLEIFLSKTLLDEERANLAVAAEIQREDDLLRVDRIRRRNDDEKLNLEIARELQREIIMIQNCIAIKLLLFKMFLAFKRFLVLRAFMLMQ
jgi:hypothetical protein